MVTVLAIDPGCKNFALCICQIETPSENPIENIKTGSILLIEKVDLNPDKQKKGREIIHSLTRFLDSKHDLLRHVDTVLVERQMLQNNDARAIANHCMSYFELKYPHTRVIEYSSTNKTHMLTKDKMTKPQRKKFSMDTVMHTLAETLAERPRLPESSEPDAGEHGNNVRRVDALKEIEKLDKKDDVCDCLLMCATFCAREAIASSKKKRKSSKK